MEVNKISTPLQGDKLSQTSATIKRSNSIKIPKLFNKYTIILAISILTCIVSASFWIYVTYIL